MPTNNTVHRHELDELITRLDWFDEERRKTSMLVSQLELQIVQQERLIEDRERRIKDLEERLAQTTLHVNRVTQLDATLQQFKDEIVAMVEQYDARATRALDENERLRRVEQEVAARELGGIQRELPKIEKLQSDMELRQAEESRLANLIGKVQTRITPLQNRVEGWERELLLLSDSERNWAKNITSLETKDLEMSRRIESLMTRVDVINNSVVKSETELQDLNSVQSEVRQMMKSWVDQIQLGEYERNQRIQNWDSTLEDFNTRMSQFSQEWIGFSDQYKEAQMAVQSLTDWQRQFEQQQRESSEMMRVETNRMQTRWDNFLADIEKRWRNFEIDQDQRLADGLRRDKTLEEQLFEMQQGIKRLETEKDALWRVQTAQLDAMKQVPRIWLEEVEKARDRDPNRRREASLVPIDEDLY